MGAKGIEREGDEVETKRNVGKEGAIGGKR